MERLRLLSEKGDADAAGRLRILEKEYAYDGDRTCAGDGLCSMSCPMGINVADLTHEIRREVLPSHPGGRSLGVFAAKHFACHEGSLPLASRFVRHHALDSVHSRTI